MAAHNILQKPLSEKELTEIFAQCPPVPLLPTQGDPVWARVAAKPLTKHWWPTLKDAAEKEVAEPMPTLPRELYGDFTRTGNRLNFEELCFERRRRLARAVICAMLKPDEKKWTDSALAKWHDVFEERSWALPAHVADPSGYDPDTLDLFSCETMYVMSEMISLFGTKVPADFKAKARKRIREMQEIYLAKADTLMWTKITNNWNAVCHQGVLGSALSGETDPQLLGKLIATASKYLTNFLKGMAPDGGCTEGPSYWNYGFGWFCRLNEQLEARTQGRLGVFEGDPLVKELAHYGRRMALEDNQVINFADCRRFGSPSAPVLAYLGQRLHQPENTAQAEHEFHRLAHAPVDFYLARSGFLQIIWNLLAAPETDRATAIPQESFIYPDLGVWVSRGTDNRKLRWTFAIKAGHNEEHHNHNDCGSFLMQINHTVFLADIGTPEYVKAFFKGGTRYSFLTARSYGHSVPLINGIEQHVGEQYRGEITRTNFGAESDEVRVEFGGSYPKEAGVKSASRKVSIEKKKLTVTIEDTFQLERAESLETALMTFVEPRREKDAIILESEGVRVRLAGNKESTRLRAKAGKIPEGLEAAQSDPAIEKLFYSDPMGKRAAVYRIVFEPIHLAASCRTELIISTNPVS